MKRTIKGLVWAKHLGNTQPSSIPTGRPRGVKRQGLVYEDKVSKELLGWKRGEWFQFWDSNGPGFCQPDFLLIEPSRVFVAEVKYTWTPLASVELSGLYLPVVREVFKRPAFGLTIVKRLRPGVFGLVTHSLQEALYTASLGYETVFQWLGMSTMKWPSQRNIQDLRAYPLT